MEDKYIFVDLDGPILEGKIRQYNCYRDIIIKGNGNAIDIDKYWDLKRSKVKLDKILIMSAYKDTIENFIDMWILEIENKKYLSMDKLKPNVISTLLSWKDNGYKVVLVTMRKNRENLLWELKENNILYIFDQVRCCNGEGSNNKYNLIKDIKFDEAVFIGDTEEDMNTAKLLGIKSIAIINGLRKKEYLNADVYFNEIQDIRL